jgi:hypothetical protein
MNILSWIKRKFKTKKSKPKQRDAFKQEGVFAHSEKVGDKKVFQMKSGKIYLAELVEIENPYNHGADDTAMRDLTWAVIDTINYRVKSDSRLHIFEGTGAIVTVSDEEFRSGGGDWIQNHLSDIWIKRYYPEQNKGYRFLRG